MIERRKGTVRTQRINDQLLHQKFRIDDRSFEDLLKYITSFLEFINFYDIDNSIDGNWKTLVEHDPVIYMTSIIKEPIHQLNSSEELLLWFEKIEQWYIKLVHLNEEVLANKIRDILVNVLKYKEVLDRLKSNKSLLSQQLNLVPYLQIDNHSNIDTQKDVLLKSISNTFKKIILHIQDFTLQYLRANFFESERHLPNNAMYITFALLYEKIQNQLNNISKRHLDFYYKDILQQTLDKGTSTRVIVCFKTDVKLPHVLIPENTKLSAGKLFGSNKNILFKTTKTLLATPIQIASIQTLFLNKNQYVDIGTTEKIISNIIINNVLDTKENVLTSNNHSLFGANQDTLISSEITTKNNSNIGIMIGSPVLYLEEGKREIILQFKLEELSSKNTFWKLLNEMVNNQKLPLDVIYNMVFEDAFVISYTSAKGWQTIHSYNVTLEEETNTFSISFILENTEPPLTTIPNYTEASIWPMIRIVLDEYAPNYAYSFFKGVHLEYVTIDVNVSEIKNLSIYNTIGKMPLTKPFDMFGPTPNHGDYLMIGKSELFKKELTNLSIKLHWDTIPQQYGGFEKYYQEYEKEFTNESFVVEITALSSGYWFPRGKHPKQTFNLFSTKNCTTPEGYDSVKLESLQTIDINYMEPYEITRDYRLEDPVKYDIDSKSAFFKITLSEPTYSFGQKLYAKEYTKIITHNTKNEDQLPLPNKPFVPKIAKITVDYKAKDTIYLNNTYSNNISSGITSGDYLHITPFEIQKVATNNIVYKNTLLPNFEGEGYLYFKLSKVNTTSAICLFFDLKNNNPFHKTENDNIIYQCKIINDWVTLTQKHILSDSTNELTKSGIIELILPQHFQNNSSHTCELRFIAKKEAYVYPVINGIYTNAVVVDCISDDPKVIGKEIASRSISKFVKQIPGIQQIIQPTTSFGGRTPGTSKLFYTQISERLRHKDRAVTLWDYEHLTLHYFPDVVAVKCTNLNRKFEVSAGKVTLIVLGNKWRNQNHQYYNTDELSIIKELLQKKSNSFIRIEVINPVVEWLLVNCVVTFHEQENSGYYMNELNEEFNNYLNPIDSTNDDIEGIGAIVIPGMLISYIKNLPYIKSVEKLNIEHIIKNGINNYTLKIYSDYTEIKTKTPWSIFVPEQKHNIFLSSAINQNESIEKIEVENLQIGLDYIIEGDDKFKKTTKNETSISNDKTQVIQEDSVTKTNKIPVTKNSTPASNTILTFPLK